MADNNKKKYIKYENTTYILQDSRIPDPSADNNGKVLGVVNGEYALKQEEGGSGAVTSVNGKTGAVTLSASDVHALPDSTVIPSAVTEQTVAGWGFTKNTGTYTKPASGIPASDLANEMPFFELPSGGQSGQALLSDGEDGAAWGEAGIPEAVKTALLNVVAHIGAWSDNKGQDYYDALYESLYNAAPVPSRLPAEYQEVEWIGSTGTQLLLAGISFSGNPEDYEIESEIAVPEANASTAILMGANSEGGFYIANVQNGSAVGLSASIYFSNLDITQKHKYVLSWDASYGIATCEGQTIRRARSTRKPEKVSFFNDYQKLFAAKCRIYSAKVKQSGVYVRDLVPCYRKSDNVIGMYDVVGNAFYINTGTGTFTKGANV